MKRTILFVAAVLLAHPALANAVSDARGVWLRNDGNARVMIAPCGDKLCATNLWIGDTSGGEAVGDRLIMTLKPVSDSKLSGTAYDPKRGLTYSMTMQVSANKLTTRGCVVGGLLCKNVNWTPAD
ncbi:MAG: DUF2147 domain-containing protein [Rhizobiaceae bacterium]|nr:DUF2147 domain-containing protein [Rhizobiaceae bacterium]